MARHRWAPNSSLCARPGDRHLGDKSRRNAPPVAVSPSRPGGPLPARRCETSRDVALGPAPKCRYVPKEPRRGDAGLRRGVPLGCPVDEARRDLSVQRERYGVTSDELSLSRAAAAAPGGPGADPEGAVIPPVPAHGVLDVPGRERAARDRRLLAAPLSRVSVGPARLGSAAAIVVGVIRNRPAHRVAWIFLALGVTTFACGDITYDVLTKFLHQSNPFPSVADVFYLATYPLLAAGLVVMVRSRRRRDGDIRGAAGRADHHRRVSVSVVDLPDPAVRAGHRHDAVRQARPRSPTRWATSCCCACSPAWCSASGTRNTSVRLLTTGVVGRAGRRLRLRLDPAARVVEGRRPNRPGLGPVLRVLGGRGAASRRCGS